MPWKVALHCGGQPCGELDFSFVRALLQEPVLFKQTKTAFVADTNLLLTVSEQLLLCYLIVYYHRTPRYFRSFPNCCCLSAIYFDFHA